MSPQLSRTPVHLSCSLVLPKLALEDSMVEYLVGGMLRTGVKALR